MASQLWYSSPKWREPWDVCRESSCLFQRPSKDIIRHCYFSLHVALYAYKSQMLQALVLKLWLAFNYLYQLILNMFLSRLVEKMKRDVDVGLGVDFGRFHREKAAASRARVADDPSLSLYMERCMCAAWSFTSGFCYTGTNLRPEHTEIRRSPVHCLHMNRSL